ncbi:MAG: SDR family NAD(P)-dependent oxidoreductase [Phycisphaerales bacterium JB063]
MGKLQDKTALVTGGSTGIGLASAKHFIKEGAFVYITGRRQDALDAALAELGPNARAVQGDIANLNDLDKLYDTIKQERGQLDILFANAGGGNLAPLGQITPEQFDQTFGINVKGTLFTVQKALPLLKPGSTIIINGSTTGVMGTPAFSVYSASKAAVRNFARSWALDLKGTGIRVNILSPGPTDTPALRGIAQGEQGQGVVQQLIDGTPLGRLGDPAETAAVAAFLASDDSSFMTGSEVFVDGGYAQV